MEDRHFGMCKVDLNETPVHRSIMVVITNKSKKLLAKKTSEEYIHVRCLKRWIKCFDFFVSMRKIPS